MHHLKEENRPPVSIVLRVSLQQTLAFQKAADPQQSAVARIFNQHLFRLRQSAEATAGHEVQS